MNKIEAKKRGFSHYGFIYGFIKIYAVFEENTDEPILTEKNWIYGLLLDVFTWIDLNFYNNEGFELELYEMEDEQFFNFYNFGMKFIFILLVFLLISMFLP